MKEPEQQKMALEIKEQKKELFKKLCSFLQPFYEAEIPDLEILFAHKMSEEEKVFIELCQLYLGVITNSFYIKEKNGILTLKYTELGENLLENPYIRKKVIAEKNNQIKTGVIKPVIIKIELDEVLIQDLLYSAINNLNSNFLYKKKSELIDMVELMTTINKPTIIHRISKERKGIASIPIVQEYNIEHFAVQPGRLVIASSGISFILKDSSEFKEHFASYSHYATKINRALSNNYLNAHVLYVGQKKMKISLDGKEKIFSKETLVEDMKKELGK